MKKSKIIAPIAAVLFLTSTAFATTTGTEVWDYGNDPLQEVLEMEAIPTINSPNAVQKLSIDIDATLDHYFEVEVPYSDETVIGVIVLDRNGEVVFNKLDTYENLKRILIKDVGDNQYTVKVFKDEAKYEAKVLVVHQ